MILPADKGRATVILDKFEYGEKVRQMLSDEKTYEKLKKDPTPIYKNKLVAILSKFKDQGKLSSELYSVFFLLTSLSHIRKDSQTLLSSKNSQASRTFQTHSRLHQLGYNTSRYLADILGPLVGQTDSFVKNSQHIVSELISLELEEDDILVSHDVVSLFTNTPVKESLDIIST